MDEQQATFTVPNEDGTETTFYILFTFDCKETGLSYMVYTDDSVDEDGGIRVSASCYDPQDEEPQLHPIRTAEEWDMIERLLNEYQQAE